MNFEFIAGSILDTLFLDVKNIPTPIAMAEEARKRGDWDLVVEYCGRQELEASAIRAPDLWFWSAVTHMYRGAWFLRKQGLDGARGSFATGERLFRLHNSHHGQMVALMALGRTDQAAGNTLLARSSYRECLKLCEELERRQALRHKAGPQRAYGSLSARLLDWIRELSAPEQPRLVRVIEATAGEPRYAPEDDAEFEVLVLDDCKYRLLGYDNGRQPIPYTLRSREKYFVVRARGDSMNGKLGSHPQIEIRNGDRLLVIAKGLADCSDGNIAVLQEEGRGPLVKILRKRPGGIVLSSANTWYADRLFGEKSPALSCLGQVLAILEETD